MKEFLVIKNYKVMSPVVDASFDDEDKAKQYAEKYFDNGVRHELDQSFKLA